MSATVVTTLDLRGLACPLPIVKTARAMRDLQAGDLIEVLATDPGSEQDFRAWCRSTGHELVAWSRDDGVFRYLLRKR